MPANAKRTPAIHTSTAALLSASLLLTACGDGASSGHAPIVRDSAGVTIVENSAARWADVPEWRLDPEPIVSIGVTEGDEAYQFFNVRGALLLENDEIVIANGGTRELRFYDASGAHLRSVGGQGEGPGEYQGLSFLYRFGGDSLVAWDWPLARGTLYSGTGDFAGNFPRPQVLLQASPAVWGAYADGSLLGSVGGVMPDEIAPGMRIESTLHFRFRPRGTTIDTIGIFSSEESWFDGSSVSSPHFAALGLRAIDGEHLHHAFGERFEFSTYDGSGRLLRVTKVNRAPVPVTAAIRDDMFERRLRASGPDQRARVERIPFPDALPAWDRMHTDDEGRVWASDYRLLSTDMRSWSIFDRDGALIARSEIPNAYSMMDIRGDRVLAVHRDELGVERVVLLRIEGG